MAQDKQAASWAAQMVGRPFGHFSTTLLSSAALRPLIAIRAARPYSHRKNNTKTGSQCPQPGQQLSPGGRTRARSHCPSGSPTGAPAELAPQQLWCPIWGLAMELIDLQQGQPRLAAPQPQSAAQQLDQQLPAAPSPHAFLLGRRCEAPPDERPPEEDSR